jgi:transcriptional regulator with XRE-family HTH domain
MHTISYIEEAKKKLGLVSDYGIAKKLGMSQAAFSRYKSGERVIDDYTAAKLAEVLKISPLEVIAAANAEREKDSGKADFWRKIATGAQAGTVVSALIFGGIIYEGQVVDNVDNLYIMRNSGIMLLLIVLIWRLHAEKKIGI